jgi:hypothetical protein
MSALLFVSELNLFFQHANFFKIICVTDCLHFVWFTHYSIHKAVLKKYNPQNVERRHKKQFVGWFEDKVSHYNMFFS